MHVYPVSGKVSSASVSTLHHAHVCFASLAEISKDPLLNPLKKFQCKRHAKIKVKMFRNLSSLNKNKKRNSRALYNRDVSFLVLIIVSGYKWYNLLG